MWILKKNCKERTWLDYCRELWNDNNNKIKEERAMTLIMLMSTNAPLLRSIKWVKSDPPNTNVTGLTLVTHPLGRFLRLFFPFPFMRFPWRPNAIHCIVHFSRIRLHHPPHPPSKSSPFLRLLRGLFFQLGTLPLSGHLASIPQERPTAAPPQNFPLRSRNGCFSRLLVHAVPVSNKSLNFRRISIIYIPIESSWWTPSGRELSWLEIETSSARMLTNSSANERSHRLGPKSRATSAAND